MIKLRISFKLIVCRNYQKSMVLLKISRLVARCYQPNQCSLTEVPRSKNVFLDALRTLSLFDNCHCHSKQDLYIYMMSLGKVYWGMQYFEVDALHTQYIKCLSTNIVNVNMHYLAVDKNCSRRRLFGYNYCTNSTMIRSEWPSKLKRKRQHNCRFEGIKFGILPRRQSQIHCWHYYGNGCSQSCANC